MVNTWVNLAVEGKMYEIQLIVMRARNETIEHVVCVHGHVRNQDISVESYVSRKLFKKS